MPASQMVTLEEYLHTDYSPDCEYVDGEVLERNVGEKKHSKLQKALLIYLAAQERDLGLFVIQEQRLQTGAGCYRIPDLMIVAGGEPDEEVLTRPPLVCIEILSPEDRMGRMLRKIQEYLEFGVGFVWVLDPATRQAFEYTASGNREIRDDRLRTDSPAIEICLTALWP